MVKKTGIDVSLVVEYNGIPVLKAGLYQGMLDEKDVPVVREHLQKLLEHAPQRGGDKELKIVITETTEITDKISLQEAVNLEQAALDIGNALLKHTRARHNLA